MRVNYKSFPIRNRGVPEQTRIWRPVLSVQIIHHHATSKRFEAIVDTGSDYCLFHAMIGNFECPGSDQRNPLIER